jgi:hypothetical protein
MLIVCGTVVLTTAVIFTVVAKARANCMVSLDFRRTCFFRTLQPSRLLPAGQQSLAIIAVIP